MATPASPHHERLIHELHRKMVNAYGLERVTAPVEGLELTLAMIQGLYEHFPSDAPEEDVMDQWVMIYFEWCKSHQDEEDPGPYHLWLRRPESADLLRNEVALRTGDPILNYHLVDLAMDNASSGAQRILEIINGWANARDNARDNAIDSNTGSNTGTDTTTGNANATGTGRRGRGNPRTRRSRGTRAAPRGGRSGSTGGGSASTDGRSGSTGRRRVTGGPSGGRRGGGRGGGH